MACCLFSGLCVVGECMMLFVFVCDVCEWLCDVVWLDVVCVCALVCVFEHVFVCCVCGLLCDVGWLVCLRCVAFLWV